MVTEFWHCYDRYCYQVAIETKMWKFEPRNIHDCSVVMYIVKR